MHILGDDKKESVMLHNLCVRLEDMASRGILMEVTQEEHDRLRTSFGEFYEGPTMYLGKPVVVG